MVLLFRICNTTLLLQSYTAPENCEFARWVDPAPIHPHHEYIYYLKNHIFDLEMAVSSEESDILEDDSSNGSDSQEAPCTIADCKCPCHNNKGPTSPPPLLPPPAMGRYYGEGSTQFAMWGHY